MKNSINYETMDWDAEVARMVAAFGIPLEFRKRDEESFRDFRFTELSSRNILPEVEIHLDVTYRNDGVQFFELITSRQSSKSGYAELHIRSDGSCWRFTTSSRALTNLMVAAVSKLGLMTDEIAQTIKESFTSNQELAAIIANRPDMQFEAIDWEAEATRFMVAFDVEEKCHFVRAGSEKKPYYYLRELEAIAEDGKESDEFVLLANGGYMSFIVYPDAYYFFIGDRERGRQCAYAGIHRDGTVLRNIGTDDLNVIAEGVFNLGLYSPEVERVFKGVYFQSRKQAWETEHKARLAGQRKNLAYDSMDWEAEARRIATAFEVAEPCRFNRHAGTARCEASERIEAEHNSRLLLKSGCYARVTYTRSTKSFIVVYENTQYQFTFDWDGSYFVRKATKRTKPRPAFVVRTISKALLFLDLFTAEVAEALNISAHELMELTLESEARNGL